VLVFRAAAFRRVGSLDLAKDDLARALALEPENADAHLERGNLRQVEGDLAGAFRDWLAVLRIESEGGLAEIARRNIRALEQQGVPRPK
jgi:tetratricopeptide (TPR) repeat protein